MSDCEILTSKWLVRLYFSIYGVLRSLHWITSSLQKIPSSEHVENMLCTQIVFFFFVLLVLTFRTIYVHNMSSICSELWIFMYLTHNSMNNLSLITCCVHKLFWMSKPVNQKNTICVHNMFSTCSELGIFMKWTRSSMNNLSSYCGLVDARINASDKCQMSKMG